MDNLISFTLSSELLARINAGATNGSAAGPEESESTDNHMPHASGAAEGPRYRKSAAGAAGEPEATEAARDYTNDQLILVRK